ncbi:hypothetical protein D6D54_09260 [Spiroplasma poulsonii]|uniref:Uncharacterized protein n=2 Tax=Spiroplasma poulsonii TaxID=2138 RepID=A0A433EL37_9MOLU|nr:hypothetical protein [Spiroplasma poulsonii]RUP74908.1 hypothetical protein D6D54_09260 [Spiroplasma poulsonii]
MYALTSPLGQDLNELEKETLFSINRNKKPLNLIQINLDKNLIIDLFNFIPFIKDFNQIKQINANNYNYDDLKINLDEDFIDFIYKNINKIKLINNNINILNDKKINCFFNKTIFDFHA